MTTRRSREKASSILRTFSVCSLRVVHPLAGILGLARLLLHLHQLGRFHRQRGVVFAERLGDHLLRLVQVRAGIDQVAGRLHRFRAAHGLEDGGHRIGMGQRVLAGVQRLAGDEGFGERAGSRQRVRLVRHRLLGRSDQLGDLRGVSLLRGQAFHCTSRNRNEATTSIWLSVTKRGRMAHTFEFHKARLGPAPGHGQRGVRATANPNRPRASAACRP